MNNGNKPITVVDFVFKHRSSGLHTMKQSLPPVALTEDFMYGT